MNQDTEADLETIKDSLKDAQNVEGENSSANTEASLAKVNWGKLE